SINEAEAAESAATGSYGASESVDRISAPVCSNLYWPLAIRTTERPDDVRNKWGASSDLAAVSILLSGTRSHSCRTMRFPFSSQAVNDLTSCSMGAPSLVVARNDLVIKNVRYGWAVVFSRLPFRILEIWRNREKVGRGL